MDLRVRRTRKLLWGALLALLANKPFNELTVDEICRRAMVNRTTFYKHYRDKQDLARRGAEEMLETLSATLEDDPDETAQQAAHGIPPEHIAALFAHVASEPTFYRLAFHGEAALPFKPILERLLAERSLSRLAKLTREVAGTVPDQMISAFGAGALVSVLSWWVAVDFAIPPETMAKHVTFMMTHGTHAAAGVV
ncbi:TetR/AcrR family transcriptional regulator [Nonomuraea diastatica]|uniref:TetR/AcrR family transcriptional regulator n=1 Tax=Nonomuraea diastatica TaxID=1848329 RepID=A0A4R4WV58_9ACTN|nr:TetR/AcrR family transcriptional regulator [Nonomuraea diastatica]TDD21619.1 TetR/AcrR family transcriptional regulator [Nonomuraea diastatica]